MDKLVIDQAFVAEVWGGNAERWSKDVRAGHDRFREVYTFAAFLKFMPAIEGQRVIDLGVKA